VRRAVIFVPDTDPHDYTRCQEHCEHHGYRQVGLVREFAAGSDMLSHDQADVLVYARDEHLPPDRVPRIERAFDAEPSGTARQRRPRPL
jgi:hypothetical protein